MKPILILGAGPTGLGAAFRLNEYQNDSWTLLEKEEGPGGLASSVVDNAGYTWDLGGHVIFSHYPFFTKVLQNLPLSWASFKRSSWVWYKGKHIPYPFQNYLAELPRKDYLLCLRGLAEAKLLKKFQSPPKNFQEWIHSHFGQGIAKLFLLPYNHKVWGYSPHLLSSAWMEERISIPSLFSQVVSPFFGKASKAWGPNALFRFPQGGGSGAIWQAICDTLPSSQVNFQEEVSEIHIDRKEVYTKSGASFSYSSLISSLPLDLLINKLRGIHPNISKLKQALLRYSPLFSSCHVIGLGVKGKLPEHLRHKSWMYFPSPSLPFYRVTVFSNYSPCHVPEDTNGWSLLLEVCESPHKPVSPTLIRDVIAGACKTGLIQSPKEVIHQWHKRLPYGYPTPFLKRDRFLNTVQPLLLELDIWSRGRFGGWKYEVSNQDHSFMQGLEAVDNILEGIPEETYFQPHFVNKGNSRDRTIDKALQTSL